MPFNTGPSQNFGQPTPFARKPFQPMGGSSISMGGGGNMGGSNPGGFGGMIPPSGGNMGGGGGMMGGRPRPSMGGGMMGGSGGMNGGGMMGGGFANNGGPMRPPPMNPPPMNPGGLVTPPSWGSSGNTGVNPYPGGIAPSSPSSSGNLIHGGGGIQGPGPYETQYIGDNMTPPPYVPPQDSAPRNMGQGLWNRFNRMY